MRRRSIVLVIAPSASADRNADLDRHIPREPAAVAVRTVLALFTVHLEGPGAATVSAATSRAVAAAPAASVASRAVGAPEGPAPAVAALSTRAST